MGLLTFVFSTILGWSYYGEKACEYLLGSRAVLPYRIFWVIAVMIGSVVKLQSVWNFADIANGLMPFPNLVALLFLSGVRHRGDAQVLWGTASTSMRGSRPNGPARDQCTIRPETTDPVMNWSLGRPRQDVNSGPPRGPRCPQGQVVPSPCWHRNRHADDRRR